MRSRVATGAVTLALALAAALCCGGCGPPSPQLPAAQANRASSAVTGIMAACGEAYQRRAFEAGSSPDQGPLRDAATMRAEELAGVYREKPQGIFYGLTLRQVVALAVRALRECGLLASAAALRRQAR